MNLLVGLLPLAAMAAPVFQQNAGDYDIVLSPIPEIHVAHVSINYDLLFNGPAGTKHFSFFFDAVDYVVLGSAGVVAIAGSTTGDEFLIAISYDDTPELPRHPYRRNMELVLIPYPSGYARDYAWMPIPYIQYGRLFAEMGGEGFFGPPIRFTYDYGVFMGDAAVPEAGTAGMLGIALLLTWWRRRGVELDRLG